MQSADTVELVPGSPLHVARIAELVWSTGAVSYDYIFGARARFERFVGRSWETPDSYFGHTEAVVAIQDGDVVGLEIGFDGARNYRTRANLDRVATALVTESALDAADLVDVFARADKASYLNPFVPEHAYYVLALAVVPPMRGTGVGARLLRHAMDRGRRLGCRELHLDVLSDNPAVGFYRAHGLATMAETIAPEPCRQHGVPMEMRMVVPFAGEHPRS
jgi:ribosomal protein S18 acetylase RimI-like enzyme